MDGILTCGRRLAKRVQDPLSLPVLQIHGLAVRNISAELAAASAEQLIGPYEWLGLETAGHFPHEEAPDLVTDALVGWLDTLPA